MSELGIRKCHAAARRSTRVAWAWSVAAALLAAPAAAQSPEVPAPPQQAVVAVRHATVHTCVPGAAPIADGYVAPEDRQLVHYTESGAEAAQYVLARCGCADEPPP